MQEMAPVGVKPAPPPVAVARPMDTSLTFEVDMRGADTLVLQGAWTRNGGTAMTFTFVGEGYNDPSTDYKKLWPKSDGTISPTSNVWTMTVSTSQNFEIPFRLSGFGKNTGRVSVTVAITGGNSSDLLTLTAVPARVGVALGVPA